MKKGGNIYFASDAHFGALVLDDHKAHEQKFVRWMDSIMNDAKALYLLGDMIDFWYEYKYVVPKGFVRFFGKLAEFVDRGIEVHWFIGNHDIWLFDYMQKEIGVIVHRNPLVVDMNGKKLFLAHGDGLGDPSIGGKVLRTIFHNTFLQKAFTWIHPRWGMGFGLTWSQASRLDKSKEKLYLGEEKEHLVQYSKQQLQSGNIDYFVYGHRHIVLDLMLSRESRILIIGDWITNFTFAVFDGSDMWIDHFES